MYQTRGNSRVGNGIFRPLPKISTRVLNRTAHGGSPRHTIQNRKNKVEKKGNQEKIAIFGYIWILRSAELAGLYEQRGIRCEVRMVWMTSRVGARHPPHKTTRPGIPASAAGGGASLVCFIGGLHRNLLIEWAQTRGRAGL